MAEATRFQNVFEDPARRKRQRATLDRALAPQERAATEQITSQISPFQTGRRSAAISRNVQNPRLRAFSELETGQEAKAADFASELPFRKADVDIRERGIGLSEELGRGQLDLSKTLGLGQLGLAERGQEFREKSFGEEFGLRKDIFGEQKRATGVSEGQRRAGLTGEFDDGAKTLEGARVALENASAAELKTIATDLGFENVETMQLAFASDDPLVKDFIRDILNKAKRGGTGPTLRT